MRLATLCIGTAACILIASLAGCAGGSSEERMAPRRLGVSSHEAGDRTPVEKFVGRSLLPTAPEELGHWWLLPMEATPEGQVIGFTWSIPLGGKVGARSAGTSNAAALEMAPILVDPAHEVTSFCVLPFVRDRGQLRPVGVYPGSGPILGLTTASPFTASLSGFYCQHPTKALTKAVTGATQTERPASLAPFFLVVEDRALAPANHSELLFAVAAKAPQRIPFGIAFRALAERPAPNEPARESAEAFLALQGTAPRALRVTGNVSGFGGGSYRTSYTTGTGGPDVFVAHDMRTTELTVEDRLPDTRPATGSRDLTVGFDFKAGPGWSFFYGSYASFCAAGRWEVRADLHGRPMNARGIVSEISLCSYIFPYVVTLLLLGAPRFVLAAEGAEGASLRFSQTYGSIPLDLLTVWAVSFGGTLQEIFGTPALAVELWGTGLAGNVPPRTLPSQSDF